MWNEQFAKMQERDPETGLDPTLFRMYSSGQGRWLTPDEFSGGPVEATGPPDPAPPGGLPYADITNPQSLNKYQYAYNNPLRYIDPNGHCIEDACILEFAAASALFAYTASPEGQQVYVDGGLLSMIGQAGVVAETAVLLAEVLFALSMARIAYE